MSAFTVYFTILTLIREMRAATWRKDTHGLFDYDSSNLVIRKFKHGKSFRVFRDCVDVNTIEERNAALLGKVIGNVGVIKDNFWVYDVSNEELNKREEPMLLVVKNYMSSDEPGTKLNQGDIIKLGRCIYFVKEIVKHIVEDDNLHSCRKMNEEHASEIRVGNSDATDEESIESPKEDGINCRICLSAENINENPIISLPCRCSGSIKFIHAKCLQEWLKSKITHQENEISTLYMWNDFVCDVCKTPYPGNINNQAIGNITRPDGSKVEILNIKKPKGNYILFQRVRLPDSNAPNSTFIINLDNKKTIIIVYLI